MFFFITWHTLFTLLSFKLLTFIVTLLCTPFIGFCTPFTSLFSLKTYTYTQNKSTWLGGGKKEHHTMGDIVSSESSLFWRLKIPPTQFDGFFCESVTRQFESDPEPCSKQDHIWKCAFTENMINGVATIDIVIQRIEVKKKGGSSSPYLSSPSSPSEGHQQEQQEHSSSSHSQTQSQMEDQQEHNQLQRHQGQGQHQLPTIDDRPARIHYKTIALHTPKTMAPLMSMFLDGSSTGDTPIRGKSSSYSLS